MTSNQEYTHAPSDSVMNQIRLSFEAYKKSTFGGKQDKILSVFQTGVKIYFSEKYILGLGTL